MHWGKLSMPERAKYIKLGVSNGITDLSVIRDTYNKYAEGGTKRTGVLDKKLDKTIYFDSRKEADEYISNNYEDPNFYQGELPELVVNARQHRGLLEQGASNFEETFGITPRDAAGLVPYIGDALDVKDIKDSLDNGNYTEAGLGALMLLLPNVIEKPLKFIGNKVRKLIPLFKEEPISQFKSELDWSPDNWLARDYTKEDKEEFLSHIPELLKIEKEAKARKDWLKNSDGTDFTGDPRDWVMARTENAKNSDFDLNNPLYSGGNSVWENNQGIDVTGEVLSRKELWTSNNPLIGASYSTSPETVQTLYIPDNTSKVSINANGRNWRNVIDGKDTNQIVEENLLDNNLVEIQNVVDVGPYQYLLDDHPLLKDADKDMEMFDFYNKYFIGDDLVLGKDVPRVSVHHNTGRFSGKGSIYRAVTPIMLTGATTYYLNNKKD